MMTEEEAKKKWCPISMVDEDSGQKCVGSYCMAWRWHKRAEAVGEAVEWKRDTGFCGLAGKDEK